MRIGVGLWLGLLLAAGAPEARYGVAVDLTEYPQGTAKEALASVLNAIEAKRFDYLVAQLADPAFVDDRVKRIYGGDFQQQVEDTRSRLDPSAVKLLGRFLKDGVWEEAENRVTVRLKDQERRLYFQKQQGRWFMENTTRGER
jgi:hypothetical protein